MPERHQRVIDVCATTFRRLPGLEYLQQWISKHFHLDRDRSVMVLGAVFAAMVLGMGIVSLSGSLQGQQTYDNDKLQELSWNNGLEILETLDMINTTMDDLESSSEAEQSRYKVDFEQKRTILEASVKRVQLLLKEREGLVSSAKKLKINTLYAPVYHNMLEQTMNRVNTSEYYGSPQPGPTVKSVADTVISDK